MKRLLAIVLFLTGTVCLVAQEAASSTTQPLPQVVPNNPNDTLPVFYTLVLDPNQRHPADDTLPDLAFRMYDPARKQGAFDYGHLGNLGSSARPLAFQVLSRTGFETGLRAFDLYQLRPEDLQFYRHARTYSHAGFSRGRNQRDAASYIKLSRTFEKGLNVALHYRTFNNLGEYRFQRVKHQSLAIGFWLPKRKNYEMFLIYANNINQQEDNGGVLDLAFFDSNVYNGAISVPMRFEAEAKTKQKRNDLHFSQFYTVGQSRNQLQLAHQLNFRTESWKFSDANKPVDGTTTREEAFYSTLLTDSRGVRHYFDLRRLDNEVTASTLRKGKNNAEAARISAGLRHSYIDLYREPLPDSVVHNLFAIGKIAFAPNKRLSIKAQGDLGLLKNTGEYRLDGRVMLNLGKAGILEGRLLSQRRPPDMIHAHLISTGNTVWDNRFNKLVENSLLATYSIPKLGFSAAFNNHVVNNFIYFDQNTQPVQTAQTIQVSQLMVSQKLGWGKFRSESSFGLQQINREDLVHLPNWYAKSGVHLVGRLFKKNLLGTAGVDFRMNGAFSPDAYQPLIGQFHLQDTFSQKPHAWFDAFIAVKVQTFRLYFRYEHLNAHWDNSNLYLTANHPQNQPTFRLGISWRFLDSNQEVPNANGANGPGGSSGPPSGVIRQ